VLEKTFIFWTYFYKRLTDWPVDKKAAGQPSLSSPEERHSRVRSWTKHVDLFEKDFVIVPINEQAHWFVCIICFPGRKSPEFWKRKLLEYFYRRSSE
jgi:Ulp1 family protease